MNCRRLKILEDLVSWTAVTKEELESFVRFVKEENIDLELPGILWSWDQLLWIEIDWAITKTAGKRIDRVDDLYYVV